ncbi:metallophosphoesterase [Streptomyces europaeiscabiei]|uniref:Metallophosphoesterase n=4 Tax=Streptomyces europaeiscabiei TaxID=146819 RepID=A0ABU4NC47_9ACTN|nr:metallophosphoesterase [Streptomyces europaeiscabiei]MDX3543059.1 metallophosphoesterase [Streptomyces europaeiscabiei]MDX3552875.1 metallophosphoesterase [Streptomyces europaeiscabiei]MDX3667599.1 metallophosphoesterase [Streptomyces europaeiscabiei]MDX3700681.1 metallophosphoesterase [Streptomyces europaeiscabiei]MDX3776975.1 metallophosphoesterase [Streptomyces europaeiscabiei]
MTIVVFVLVALLVLGAFGALHWYAWRRLVRDTTRGPGLARRVGTVVFVAGPVLMFAGFAAERTGAPFWLQQTLTWPGFMWLALSLYLLLALVAGELVRPLVSRLVARRAPEPARQPEPLVREPEPQPVPAGAQPAEAAEPGQPTPPTATEPPAPPAPAAPTDPSRRLFVSRVVGGAVAAAAVGTVGYGTYGVVRGPRLKRVTVPLAKLPRAAHGFRIAVVSDIHLSPMLGRGFAQKVVDTINSTQPDLIAVVGDLVDGDVADLGPAAAPLAGLKARHGSYFVTGNHEYISGAEQWVEEVRRLGLTPLENARRELPYLDLAGVNDIAGEDEGQGPDFAKALGDRDTSRAVVLMAHQPVQIHDAVDHGVDLQLSGHTHGGQMWPMTYVAEAANPTLAGLERYGDTQLYVSRGAGAWGPPVRVGAPSDITVVQLASKQA